MPALEIMPQCSTLQEIPRLAQQAHNYEIPHSSRRRKSDNDSSEASNIPSTQTAGVKVRFMFRGRFLSFRSLRGWKIPERGSKRDEQVPRRNKTRSHKQREQPDHDESLDETEKESTNHEDTFLSLSPLAGCYLPVIYEDEDDEGHESSSLQ
jgi:hypothetical protein